MEIETFELDVKVLGTELIWEGDVKVAKIDIYWNSHGKKIYDNDPGTRPTVRRNCHVKIISTKKLIEGPIREDTWNVYFNGRKFKYPTRRYNYIAETGILELDCPWGCG